MTTATVMTANLSGADLTTVAHTVKAVQSRVIARPELKRPEDIKGKRLASTGLGSLGDFLHRVVMKRHGVNPERDVTWLTIGAPPDRVQALEAKLVDAADLSYPFDVQAQKKGYRMLWDARIEVPYPSMSVVTRKRTVQEDRDTVMRMLRAHVEGIHFLKTQKEASQKILAKYLKNNDRELLEGRTKSTRTISSPRPIRSPRAWKRPMSTSPSGGRKFTVIKRKSSPTPVLSPSSTRADLSKSYTGKNRPAATGDCAIRRNEIMVKASVKKILSVTLIASIIGLPLFAQAQDKPLKKDQLGSHVLVRIQLDSMDRQRREDLREERARCRVGLVKGQARRRPRSSAAAFLPRPLRSASDARPSRRRRSG